MKIQSMIAAVLVAALPLLANAQTSSTTPTTAPSTTTTQPKPTTTVKKKKKKPATTSAPATAAPAPAAETAVVPAPAPAAAAPVAAPVAAPAPEPTRVVPAVVDNPAPSLQPVGQVAFITGVASVTASAGTQPLHVGDPIYEAQTITVAPNSYANLKFNDGGRVLLRPNSEFTVERLRLKSTGQPPPPPAAGQAQVAEAGAVQGTAFFKLVRGGFRAISGLIGKSEHENYRVTTPAATIGIRGTDYEVQTCDADCEMQIGAIAGSTEVAANELAGLELAQAGSGGGGGGVIVATNAGAISLRTVRGELIVDAGHVAIALRSGEVKTLARVPDALLVNSTPSPEACE